MWFFTFVQSDQIHKTVKGKPFFKYLKWPPFATVLTDIAQRTQPKLADQKRVCQIFINRYKRTISLEIPEEEDIAHSISRTYCCDKEVFRTYIKLQFRMVVIVDIKLVAIHLNIFVDLSNYILMRPIQVEVQRVIRYHFVPKYKIGSKE